MQGLEQFKQAEAARITHLERTAIPDMTAESLILRAYEQGIISHLQLPQLIRAWREPEFEEFRPRTLWSLWNAFTTATSALQRSNPQRFCATTITLQGMFAAATPDQAAESQFVLPA